MSEKKSGYKIDNPDSSISRWNPLTVSTEISKAALPVLLNFVIKAGGTVIISTPICCASKTLYTSRVLAHYREASG